MNKNCFDFLRIVFAVDILLAHLCELSQNKNLAFLTHFTNANIGITGFFTISGFLVAKSFTNTPSLKDYFIKRAKRILPAYVFVLLFAALFLVVFSNNSFFEYYTNSGVYQYLGWNLVFLNFMHPCLPGVFGNNLMCAVNGSLWTLKVEEGFYIILPFLFYIIKKTQKPFFTLLILYFLSLLYWHFMTDYYNKPVLAKQLPGYLAYFVVGIFLYLNLNFVITHKSKLFAAAILIFIMVHFTSLQLHIFYPAAFGILLIILAYSLPFLNNFGKYGDFTYGIYIYHFPIIQIFRQCNLFERYNTIVMAMGVLAITFLCAVFSWFVIEKRFLDRYKKTQINVS